jgi:GT2 family glycosyltransferase
MPDSQRQEPVTNPLVSFITVNWQSVNVIGDLLSSLRTASDFSYEIIVVSNDQQEHRALDDLCSRHPEALLCGNATNIGFAAGCNQGAANARASQLIFVNPDVRFERFPASALTEAIARFGDRFMYGTILQRGSRPARGSVRRFPNRRRVLIDSGGLDRIIPSLRGSGLHYKDEAQLPPYSRIEQPIGAFIGITRTLFDELGGFDERFFVFFEEVDLALRAARAGAPIVLLPQISAQHAGGHSTKDDRTVAIGLRWRSMRTFYAKHDADLKLPPCNLLIAIEAVRFTLQRLMPGRRLRFSLRRALRLASQRS